jgi:hypothetical protein
MTLLVYSSGKCYLRMRVVMLIDKGMFMSEGN